MSGVTRITKEMRSAVKTLVLLDGVRGWNVFIFTRPFGKATFGSAPRER
jgi:hypothetical protein